ncbi:hypothetical protein TetV_414 [Tetraselmis virus 1]|uniref:Uncharacterized protein n=1 Tax=Tetraselmis virus 1 TaxID=2060617 RepID=A0A2P0VNK7_9VIRU|nr:hypothetical protein QJ968_gp640 [Tetraselmis virus 1]AUF82496.1 hypothetical protein TetV_414 [Tetraselmis virus 1]
MATVWKNVLGNKPNILIDLHGTSCTVKGTACVMTKVPDKITLHKIGSIGKVTYISSKLQSSVDICNLRKTIKQIIDIKEDRPDVVVTKSGNAFCDTDLSFKESMSDVLGIVVCMKGRPSAKQYYGLHSVFLKQLMKRIPGSKKRDNIKLSEILAALQDFAELHELDGFNVVATACETYNKKPKNVINQQRVQINMKVQYNKAANEKNKEALKMHKVPDGVTLLQLTRNKKYAIAKNYKNAIISKVKPSIVFPKNSQLNKDKVVKKKMFIELSNLIVNEKNLANYNFLTKQNIIHAVYKLHRSSQSKESPNIEIYFTDVS